MKSLRYPAFGGDQIRASFQQLRGHPDGNRRGRGDELSGHLQFGRGIATQYHLEAAHRLIKRPKRLSLTLLGTVQIGFGEILILRLGSANFHPGIHYLHYLSVDAHRFLGQQFLKIRLCRQKPGLGGLGDQRLASELKVCFGGAESFFGGTGGRAEFAPYIEFPLHVQRGSGGSRTGISP